MAPIADFILEYVPLPSLPSYLVSYIPGQTPLSTAPTVFTALAGYLATIFGLREVMKDRQPQKLNALFQVHNVILSGGSLILLVLMLEEILPIVWNHGIYYAICAEESWTPRMEFYYMINYYFKYLELLDTVFLAMKKKPLAFLHVFHHSATALLCFTQLGGKTSVSWVVITLNLGVHVLMYYYYYATAGGAKIWWKKYLTLMQITQFVIDLGVVYFGSWCLFTSRSSARTLANSSMAGFQHFAYAYRPDLPHVGNCAGTENAALFGCALLTSYLGLFINFYLQTYKKPVKGGKAVGNGAAKANGNAAKKE
ncbi:hypothetical protein PLICRDRAFT_700491 [Plicaturopsis crispa FD-325 SS-3]|nr:hypothetical protein PLICRDRAFT_700491 [Plicaturopsis crispa FD-325 SS-3]